MTFVNMPDGTRVYRATAIAQCRAMVETPHGDDHAELVTLREGLRQVLAILASFDTTVTRLDGKW